MYFLNLAILVGSAIAAAVPKPFVAPRPHNKNYIASTAERASKLAKRAEGGVKLCTGVEFTGQCDYVAYPWNECINLEDYAGQTFSFLPDAGNECYLMQGECNGDLEYADLTHNSSFAGNLEDYPWIRESQSYMCFDQTIGAATNSTKKA